MSKDINNTNKLAILLLEQGEVQYYHYLTLAEWAKKPLPTEVYWRHMKYQQEHGPFESIYEAGKNHKEWLKNPTVNDPPKSNVIHVDFKTKRRL